jgi:hypothetical protein
MISDTQPMTGIGLENVIEAGLRTARIIRLPIALPGFHLSLAFWPILSVKGMLIVLAPFNK